MRVLVTGFSPFLSHAVNPSDTLARALHGRRTHGVTLISHTPLPVVHGLAARIAIGAARRHRVHAVVALGLAGGSRCIRLETLAHNRSTSDKPDATGRSARGRSVVPGAPFRLPATLSPAPIRRALKAAGFDAELSADAGGYVCNDLFYRLLHTRARWRTIFVHVPEHIAAARVAGPLASGIASAVIASSRHRFQPSGLRAGLPPAVIASTRDVSR